jgi:regulator of protease activity HflC (stomatin/prohibitin superfamily)
MNPFAWNDAGHRTVVERMSGEQIVQYTPGVYYAGFFSKTTEWPNQISVSYQDTMKHTVEDYEVNDGSIEIGFVEVRFGGGVPTTARTYGIAQYVLPTDPQEMINMHNAHRTPQSLVAKRLAPYTSECLASSAQLMSAEMHYSGGRATMAQNYLDQLQKGVYLLTTVEKTVYDSLENETKKVYENIFQTDTIGNKLRKFSSIKEYGITVADAQITTVDYEQRVDDMLGKKIESATKASVSKQEAITAQQQAISAKAEGERNLITIEYQQKQEQTKQVVQAETQVKLAEKDKEKQRIAAEAAELEARKIKTLADATAYEKQRIMSADGALDKKLEAYKYVMAEGFKAISNYEGAWVPSIISGGGGMSGNNAAFSMMEMLSIKAAKDLSLDMNTK